MAEIVMNTTIKKSLKNLTLETGRYLVYFHTKDAKISSNSVEQDKCFELKDIIDITIHYYCDQPTHYSGIVFNNEKDIQTMIDDMTRLERLRLKLREDLSINATHCKDKD